MTISRGGGSEQFRRTNSMMYGSHRYQAMDVMSMTPGRRVVLLYRHLLAVLERALRAMRARDIEGRNTNLTKAQAIVHELLGSLDREAGGRLAGNLAALYAFFLREASEIDQQPDPARLQRLVDLVTPLYQAWEQAAEQVERPISVSGAM